MRQHDSAVTANRNLLFYARDVIDYYILVSMVALPISYLVKIRRVIN